MRRRIANLILLVVICQLLTCGAVLLFGGEFRELKQYSYNTLVEKTESGGTYIQNELRQTAAIARIYADELNGAVADTLAQQGAAAADLRTDKALADSVISACLDVVEEALRGTAADDAYFILDTGALYSDGGDTALAALYLSREQTGDDRADEVLTLVIGPKSLARSGLTLHSDWSERFAPKDESSADFYARTVDAARESSGLAAGELGYWSGASRVTSSIARTVKYSLPVIAQDGTVYGVMGVGLAERTVMSSVPDVFLSENVCYALGRSETGASYDVLAHTGNYAALLGETATLRLGSQEAEGVSQINASADAALVGSARSLELYDGASPYAGEQWAFISVADKASVLYPVALLQRMLVTGAILSVIICSVIAAVGCGVIVKPISDLSKAMKIKRKYNEIIRFEPSKIYEINEITDAATQMQINALEFSSQVSRMISVADVGVGTFMYNRADDSVFVGQSLIKVLKLDLPQGDDIMMSRQDFLSSIKNSDVRAPIADGLEKADGRPRRDSSEVYQIGQPNGDTAWMRLDYTYSPTSAIGIVQDITDTTVEKNRIEFERDHDNLTGLLTRPAYYRSVERLFHDEDKLNITAFVMIDLDNLKFVNDTYGHDFGDEYIRTAAAALKKAEKYGGTVARLSGDEFNICLSGFDSKEAARKVIDRVREELLQGTCLLADGTHFKVSASFGVSWYPDDADTYELLMKYADFAMYTVKHTGKSGIAEFDIESYSTDSDKLADLEELNRIIDESRVQYAFQSIVSVQTGGIYGYEALMRVQSEIFQSPLELLNIARTNGKLHDIERLTWTKALSDFQKLLDAGKVNPSAHLFINSIANQRLGEEIVAGIEKAYPHLHGKIVMEVLESESADQESTEYKEKIMGRWGGQIALDDYGTGYNSEYALLSLQPNIIKIDRSIISGCDQDADRRMIIENVVKLSRAKGVSVLAEGVETEQEMQTVITCGVDFLQGFYLARPVFEPVPISARTAETIRRMAAGAATDL